MDRDVVDDGGRGGRLESDLARETISLLRGERTDEGGIEIHAGAVAAGDALADERGDERAGEQVVRVTVRGPRFPIQCEARDGPREQSVAETRVRLGEREAEAPLGPALDLIPPDGLARQRVAQERAGRGSGTDGFWQPKNGVVLWVVFSLTPALSRWEWEHRFPRLA